MFTRNAFEASVSLNEWRVPSAVAVWQSESESKGDWLQTSYHQLTRSPELAESRSFAPQSEDRRVTLKKLEGKHTAACSVVTSHFWTILKNSCATWTLLRNVINPVMYCNTVYSLHGKINNKTAKHAGPNRTWNFDLVLISKLHRKQWKHRDYMWSYGLLISCSGKGL